MFAKQATMLLEFAARLCKSDTTGNVLKNFSNELNKIDPNYFRVLPSSCVKNVVKQNNQFVLPNIGNTTGKTLLWALFDLVSNGLAHQYQQIIVELKDNKRFYVSLARGADFQGYLSVAMNQDQQIILMASSMYFFNISEAGLSIFFCESVDTYSLKIFQ